MTNADCEQEAARLLGQVVLRYPEIGPKHLLGIFGIALGMAVGSIMFPADPVETAQACERVVCTAALNMQKNLRAVMGDPT